MSMLCPKCQNLMTQYERSGVVIDQCTECKGLFLDRGELERLSEAERAWNSGGRGDRYDDDHRHRDSHDRDHDRDRDRGYDRRYDDRRYAEGRHDDRHHGDRHHDDRRHGKPHKRRRGSFFEELFDFD